MSHKESVQEARRKAAERLQQIGADNAYVSEFASGSGNAGYGSRSNGYVGGGFGASSGGYGGGRTGFSAGLKAAVGSDPALCTVPCERYYDKHLTQKLLQP